MLTLPLSELLAQVPDTTVYVNPWKLAGVVALFAIWVKFAQWVDKDTIAVNTYRNIWNLISVSCGSVAMLVLLFVPIFWAAAAGYLVVVITLITAYVLHRNGLVEEHSKVLTPAHIKRVMREGFSGKKGKDEKLEVKERVHLRDVHDDGVAIPDEPVARQQYALTQDVLWDALWRRANRIDVIPAGQASKIRMSVDGVAVERDPLPRPEGDAVLMFVKKLAGLSLEERRKPQRGKLAARIGDHTYAIDVRTNGSTAGESLSLRVLGEERNFRVRHLGFNDEQLKQIEKLMETDNGLVIFSAPPNNGLSTTIYTFARSHDAFLQNIQTVERDKEMEVENITQHVYVPSEDKPFSAELQRVGRTDPDVIFVPDIGDSASAAILAELASRKANAYTTIQAADVLDALRKWIALVRDTKLAAKGLTAVLHQRLVRKLCASCKTPYKPDPATLKRINMPPDAVLYRPPETQYDKHGNPILCQACQGTGYIGRTAVFAILPIDDELRRVIAGGAALPELKAAIKNLGGGISLQSQALKKVLEGVTSIDEARNAMRAVEPAQRKSNRAAQPKPPTSQPEAGSVSR